MADTDELLRFVRIPAAAPTEGIVVYGPTMAGRGAWLCASTLDDCAALAVHRRAFDRAFRGPVRPESVPDAVRVAARSVRASRRSARG